MDEREPILIKLPQALARDITQLARDNKRSRVREIEVAVERYIEHLSAPHANERVHRDDILDEDISRDKLGVPLA
jgi:hypothetical protein